MSAVILKPPSLLNSSLLIELTKISVLGLSFKDLVSLPLNVSKKSVHFNNCRFVLYNLALKFTGF